MMKKSIIILILILFIINGVSGQTIRRIELIDSKTEIPDISAPSKNPADRTPIPVEYPDHTAYLPDALNIRIPYAGRYQISNAYGYQSRSWTHRTIANQSSANDFFALDIIMPIGIAILAVADGQILTSQDRSTVDSYGKYIVIDHGNGYRSIYAHLSKLEFEVHHAEPVVHVKQGQKIGESGNSGRQNVPHLHFAIHKDSWLSPSGADIGGLAVIPEPISGYYGLRNGHWLGE